jgi:hypothetical protein
MASTRVGLMEHKFDSYDIVYVYGWNFFHILDFFFLFPLKMDFFWVFL